MQKGEFNIIKSELRDQKETLSVDLIKGEVKAHLKVFRFQDTITKQFVIYVPSMEISGYGETKKIAEEMAITSLRDFITSLIELNEYELNAELIKCGWSKTFFKKQFAKVFVDGNGLLQGFNADPATIEQLTLVNN